MKTLLWLHGGCCGGDSISLINGGHPDFLTAFDMIGLKIVYHPSLTVESGDDLASYLEKVAAGKDRVDLLVLEGAVVKGPGGSGLYSTLCGRPTADWMMQLAGRARDVMAVGTCASFGGIMTAGSNDLEATGLQYHKTRKGGLLGADFISKSGLPVINIPGCPAHPDWIIESIILLISGQMAAADLDSLNRPRNYYGKLAHHACPRNEYYEFKASAEDYSQQGCLFENLGCKATQCESDCNERLWLNGTGSCTRGGFPCISCTSPKFPDGFLPFFETSKIGDVPTTLPLDVPKAWYIGISGLSKLACPERLRVNAVSHRWIDVEE